MGVWSAVTAIEEYGTREEGFVNDNNDTSYANVVLRCDVNQSGNLIRDLLINERPYPYNNELPLPLFAKSAQRTFSRGKYITNGTEELCNYFGEIALVAVHYRKKSFCEIVRDPLTGEEISITEELEPITEFLLQDFRDYAWVSAALDSQGQATGELSYDTIRKEEATGKLLQRTALKRTMSGLSYVSPDLLKPIGKVNDKPYYSLYLGQTFEKETLLYTSPIIRNQSCTKDDVGMHKRKWEVSMKLVHKDDGEAATDLITGETPRAGWNHYWRVATQQWERQYIPVSSTFAIQANPYKLADLSNVLFEFGGINPVVTPMP